MDNLSIAQLKRAISELSVAPVTVPSLAPSSRTRQMVTTVVSRKEGYVVGAAAGDGVADVVEAGLNHGRRRRFI